MPGTELKIHGLAFHFMAYQLKSCASAELTERFKLTAEGCVNDQTLIGNWFFQFTWLWEYRAGPGNYSTH